MRCRDPLPVAIQAEIIKACCEDDVINLERLLNDGKTVSNVLLHSDILGASYIDHFGSFEYLTPLQLSAVCGSWRCLQLLITHRALVNFEVAKTDRHIYQPLYLCVRSSRENPEKRTGYEKSIKLLLDAGAKPSLGEERFYGSLLHLVVDLKLDASILDELIKHGAEVNKVNARHFTPLHQALIQEREIGSDYISTLLAHTPDVNKQDNLGRTALTLSAEYGLVDVVYKLHKHAPNYDILTYTSETALHCACRNGHIEIISMLIEKSCKINHTNSNGYTALDLFIKALSKVMSDDAKSPRKVAKCLQKLLNFGAFMNDFQPVTLKPMLQHQYIHRYTQTLCLIINSLDYIDLYEIIDQTHVTSDNEILFEQLFVLGNGPRTLRHLCRCTIRRCIRTPCHFVRNLPLPELLKSYLLLDVK
ncbi:ankyrin repeat and SOCS box protein 16-like [Saccoglossus kowalevskii]|uniref:Ankyrin-3-like n=1 Tax=Saccoglossus kowalevskii TaxID=10224 RepID=A0ABM0MK20_SACKO|nr:PREDICTED: ankyrin-3-like [Saccoglossus kowalevskii]